MQEIIKGIDNLRTAINENNPAPKNDFIDIYSLAPDVIREIKTIANIDSNYNAFQIACHIEKAIGIESDEKDRITRVLEKYQFNSSKLQGEAILKRFEKITMLIGKTIKDTSEPESSSTTEKIDNILMHNIFGYLIMFLVFFLIFQAIFSWSEYPMQLIESGFGQLNHWLNRILPPTMLTHLLTEGILAGLSGICIFIPQIVILFGFITIMEDTGYMTRVSFLMDLLMRKVGLNGKSVVPLMSGFACAIPAVMASRNIENWKERLVTIMIIPLMSCSARLPVYTILVSLVVPDETIFGIFNLKGLTFMGLYLLGIITALVASYILSIFIKIKENGYFIMELPIYRAPRWGNVLHTMFEKAKIFTYEAGRIILIISIFLWFMASYGPGKNMSEINKKYADPELISKYPADDINKMVRSEKLTHSYAGLFGQWIEPAIQPLGFDWKIGIALISSFAAREVFVGTMATFYSVGSNDSDFLTLREKMRGEINPKTNEPFYTVAVAFSLMIFYVFAMQCISTLAVVKRETKSWKWPIIQFFFMTGMAYCASFVTYMLLK